MTASRFNSRLEAIDEGSQEFLQRLIELGGYCTADQAKRLTLSDESTGTRGRLRALERACFLRRITRYPVIYQVTKSAVWLIARDSSARRSHVTATIQARLLGVSFYLEAKEWPAQFVFDHEEKITTFHNAVVLRPRFRSEQGNRICGKNLSSLSTTEFPLR